MTIADQKPVRTSPLVARVKGILLSPNAEWDVIEHEPATTGGLYAGYAIPLALIAPVCGAIGALVFGYGGFGFSYHPGIVFVLTSAIVRFVLSLVSIFVLALIINALAPTFSGEKSQIQALKIAVYSSTASYVAGVFSIFPPLGVLAILGLYSLYLMYCGLPKLMKSPADKSLAYTAVVIVCAIVLFIVIGAVTAPLAMLGAGSAFAPARVGAATGTFNVPGGGSVDMSKLAALAQSVRQTSSTASSGGSAGAVSGPSTAAVVPVSTDTLRSLLPANIDGYERTSISSASGAAGPIAGANAKATYTKGSSSIELTVADMAVLGGLAKAFNVQSDSETATGYEKVGQVDGRLTTEKYDRQSKSGSYSVMAGSRFLVQADGSNVDMANLKDAIAMVGPQRLDTLATAH